MDRIIAIQIVIQINNFLKSFKKIVSSPSTTQEDIFKCIQNLPLLPVKLVEMKAIIPYYCLHNPSQKLELKQFRQ